MGTWGPGNLDNDDASDFLGHFIDKIIADIGALMDEIPSGHEKAYLEDYGETQVMPLLDVVLTLFDTYHSTPLVEYDTVKIWKRKYLAMYDLAYPDYAEDKFESDRRQVIETTFDRLIHIFQEE